VELNRPRRDRKLPGAIKIDDQSYPAKVNLALLCDAWAARRRPKPAEEVVAAHPQLLTRLLAGAPAGELQKDAEAASFLEKAPPGMPTGPAPLQRGLLRNGAGTPRREAALNRGRARARKSGFSLRPWRISTSNAAARQARQVPKR